MPVGTSIGAEGGNIIYIMINFKQGKYIFFFTHVSGSAEETSTTKLNIEVAGFISLDQQRVQCVDSVQDSINWRNPVCGIPFLARTSCGLIV